jgi:TetR/AcrR family transcriptional regulator, regulator of cefoperazone and chloramphenicol sensitivity
MAISEETRNRLLEAAGQLFAEKGYEDATVREICRRAGVNFAAVNYHFGDKEQLYRAALKHAFQCRLDQLPLPQWPEGTPAAVRLRDFIHTLLRRMMEMKRLPWQMQLLMRALPQPTPAGEELVREFIRPIYGLLWGILGEVLPEGVSEEKVHLVAFSIVGQAFYFNFARNVIGLVVSEEENRRYEPERLAQHISEFTLAALGLGAPLGGKGE